jgi:NADPH:quinone reductase-like Zn-dependent oxidoreductase
MKAACYTEYGDPTRLEVREVPVPQPGASEVLVRVLSVSLNASDVEFLRGAPAYTRAWGLRRPKHPTLGSDCAGCVAAVGEKVTEFKPGDLVFGDLLGRWGALAEYVVAPAQLWVAMPAGLSPEVACMLPQAGVVAWQAVLAGPVKGKRFLVNGAGGGSGTLTIQLAKLWGAAQVVAVDRAEKATALRELGADAIIDYQTQDYTEQAHSHDRIIDLVGSRSLADNARALAAGGEYHLVGGNVPRLLAALTLGPMRSLVSSKKLRLLAVQQSRAAIALVAEAQLRGEITPITGARFALKDVRDAFHALCSGQIVGKVLVVP